MGGPESVPCGASVSARSRLPSHVSRMPSGCAGSLLSSANCPCAKSVAIRRTGYAHESRVVRCGYAPSSPIGLAVFSAGEAHQRTAEMGVRLLARRGARRLQELPRLRQGRVCCQSDLQDHPPMFRTSPPEPPMGSFLLGRDSLAGQPPIYGMIKVVLWMISSVA